MVYFALILGIVAIFFRRKFFALVNILKYPYFILFLPLVLFPVIRCKFKIPYIFCRACPSPCPWGLSVRLIIPGFLIQNVDRKFWCYKLCPFGTIQNSQTKICKLRLRVPKWLRNIRYAILAFVVLSILAAFNNISVISNLFFRGSYSPVIITISVAIIIFLLSFFIPSLWCNYICPIGTCSDIVLKVERKITK